MTFKVGDIVECVENEDRFVRIGAIGKVTSVDSRGVHCLWTSGDFLEASNNVWHIESHRVKLLAPKLETLIKRANMGAKAVDQILKYYPNRVETYDESQDMCPISIEFQYSEGEEVFSIKE